MQLKISCFNPTLFRKNLSRFWPLWGMTSFVGVLFPLVMFMEFSRGSRIDSMEMREVYFNMSAYAVPLISLFYAVLCALAVWNYLYHPRSVGLMHTLPIRREGLFLTNFLSGMAMMLIPYAITGVLTVLITAVFGCFDGLGILVTVATVVADSFFYFAFATAIAFVTGNVFALAILYFIFHFLAVIMDFMLSTFSAGFLFGVDKEYNGVVEWLSPTVERLRNIGVDSVYEWIHLENGTSYRECMAVTMENWHIIPIYAAVGVALTAAAWLLYRHRRSESAGDVVAVRWLAPVFLVAAAVAGGAAAVLMLEMFFYSIRREFVIYALAVCGIAVGWFAGKMLLERSTRVFRLKNWLGLGVLAVLFAVSLGMTRFDVFGIETRTPDVNKVASVSLNVNGQIDLTEKEDIAQIICLQEMALEDRLEDAGAYPASYIEELGTIRNVKYPEEGFLYDDKGTYDRNEHHYYADTVLITYHMENGRTVERRYTIWASFEEGEIIKEYASRWEVVQNNSRGGYEDELDFKQLHSVTVAGKKMPEELMTEENIRQLLAAVKADCEERTMTQDSYYHTGRFKIPAEMEGGDPGEFYYESGIYVDITTWSEGRNDLTGMWLRIFADSRHSLEWLRAHDLLPYDTVDGNYLG